MMNAPCADPSPISEHAHSELDRNLESSAMNIHIEVASTSDSLRKPHGMKENKTLESIKGRLIKVRCCAHSEDGVCLYSDRKRMTTC